MHANVKGAKHNREKKEKICSKENRKEDFRRRETEKSTAGNRRRLKEKTREVGGQNEMLRREMQKSKNAWTQSKKARPKFLIGVCWYSPIKPYWFMSPENPVHWLSWSFMDWHHLSIWLRLWAAVQTRIHDTWHDSFLGHNLFIAPNSPDY